jgi:hypothetical protein
LLLSHGNPSNRLFLQRLCCLARALAGTCVGLGALTANWKTTAVTETTVAANVHQTLDVHGGLTAQVTLDRENADLVANFLKFSVAEVFNLFGVVDATSLADLASAGATDTENCRQADFGVLVRRNVDACNTSHVGPLNFNQP